MNIKVMKTKERDASPTFLTIDVEEYFHLFVINGTPPMSEWDSYPGRVEANMKKILDLLDNHNIKATCFFLGYIAKKYPQLVQETHNRGHEIASHGMYHQLIYDMTPEQFLNDLSDSKHLLQDIISEEVIGYRSPSFSVSEKNPWLFDQLASAGFKYDSSVFPAKRLDGGLTTKEVYPHWIKTKKGALYEFPISVVSILGKNICLFGGGYLRLFPKFLILNMSDRLRKKGNPVLYYIHPREIDPDNPRLHFNFLQSLRFYINIRTVIPKLEAIFQRGNFITLGDFYRKELRAKNGK